MFFAPPLLVDVLIISPQILKNTLEKSALFGNSKKSKNMIAQK
jgi:hypothetical protein